MRLLVHNVFIQYVSLILPCVYYFWCILAFYQKEMISIKEITVSRIIELVSKMISVHLIWGLKKQFHLPVEEDLGWYHLYWKFHWFSWKYYYCILLIVLLSFEAIFNLLVKALSWWWCNVMERRQIFVRTTYFLSIINQDSSLFWVWVVWFGAIDVFYHWRRQISWWLVLILIVSK